MAENNKRILPDVNGNNVTEGSKKVIQNPKKGTSDGCWCGVASCENCPGCPGVEMGSDRKVVYRNIFPYLRVVTVILIAACVLEKALKLLSI